MTKTTGNAAVWDSQYWLKERMAAFGYDVSLGGQCHGVAMMGLQAFLLGDISLFHKRLKYLRTKKVSFFQSRFERKKTTSKKYPLYDIQALFDGIVLYQKPKIYPSIFKQTERCQYTCNAKDLVKPVALENRQSSIAHVASSHGVYSQQELKTLLRLMQTQINTPIAIIINAQGHAINLNYSHQDNKWFIINASRLPVMALHSVEEVLIHLQLAFKLTEKQSVMEFKYYALNTDILEIKTNIHSLQQQSAWRIFHKINAAKAQFKDKRGLSWLFYAARAGHYQLVKTLIRSGADINLRTEKGVSVLKTAAKHGHTKIVSLLLKKGAMHENHTHFLRNAAYTIKDNKKIAALALIESPDAINYISERLRKKKKIQYLARIKNKKHRQQEAKKLLNEYRGQNNKPISFFSPASSASSALTVAHTTKTAFSKAGG